MEKKNTLANKPQQKVEDPQKTNERELLESWHPHIQSAMKQLHTKFLTDTKFILTESDLKSWLFYYLQHEKPYTPFAVHTEVTHYAEHQKNDKEPEKKYKFRDLSLLCPWKITANEYYIKQNDNNKDILSKGFRHDANAIHFELKFVREVGSNNEINGLKEDIGKLKLYTPNVNSPIRDFVIICGSRSEGTNVEAFIDTVCSNIKKPVSDVFKQRVRFYLFDKKKMVCLRWDGTELKETELK